MPGKQARVLSDHQLALALRHVRQQRHPLRGRLILLFSIKAGLRAGEIARLTWPMILDESNRLARAITLSDSAAKRGSGRVIPLHPQLRAALLKHRRSASLLGPVLMSERGGAMTAASIVNWFAKLYRALGFAGCSSHSGRRTFITKAARRVHRAGGSLRDVQELAGHRSIEMTQRYIEGDSLAKRRLVRLI
jgi:integrase